MKSVILKPDKMEKMETSRIRELIFFVLKCTRDIFLFLKLEIWKFERTNFEFYSRTILVELRVNISILTFIFFMLKYTLILKV